MKLYNNNGVVGTTDTLVFTCGEQDSIFNIILANITGTDSTVDIKIFNKKNNTTGTSVPDGNDLPDIYLGKGLTVPANNTLEVGVGLSSYYLTKGDEVLVSSPDADTLHFHVNVQTNL